MLKRLFQISIFLLLSSVSASTFANNLLTDTKLNQILTTDQKEIIKDIWDQDALREWAYNFKLIKRLINYALGLVSLIALIILLIAGVQMATAAGDDKKFWAGKASLLKVARAIWWIAVSWLIINFIFWIIEVITKNV